MRWHVLLVTTLYWIMTITMTMMSGRVNGMSMKSRLSREGQLCHSGVRQYPSPASSLSTSTTTHSSTTTSLNGIRMACDHLYATSVDSIYALHGTSADKLATAAATTSVLSSSSRVSTTTTSVTNASMSWPWPLLSDDCYNITWQIAIDKSRNPSTVGAYGSCSSMSNDDQWYYISSNGVPDHYVAPYCPGDPANATSSSYCFVTDHICVFDDIFCGVDAMSIPNITLSRPGYTIAGDVWTPNRDYYKIPLTKDPTIQELPMSMYSVAGKIGTLKTVGAAIGVAINGVPILGSGDAGSSSIDAAGVTIACGGHVTPPVYGRNRYHYHKAPECMKPFRVASCAISEGGRPYQHGPPIGKAMDGANIYPYSDINGAAPVLDECGGHFGYVPDKDEPVYHYHSTTYAPYTLACFGPALGRCNETQSDPIEINGIIIPSTNYCGWGCGAQICIQPGTDMAALKNSLANFNATWFDSYTNNLESPHTTSSSSLHIDGHTTDATAHTSIKKHTHHTTNQLAPL
jgi:hypothetical protein